MLPRMRNAKRLIGPLVSVLSIASRIWPSDNRPDATTTAPAARTTTIRSLDVRQALTLE